ncbi:MAG: DNA polymerase III subunit delta' [Candidatus Riflebacteria bacterium]
MGQNDVRFSQIMLQEAPISHLCGSYANGRLAQTYLFAGPRSCGRFRTARAFAALIQCSAPVRQNDGRHDACGTCDACRRIGSGSHPDVHHITPEGYEIRIDQVRALQETAVLKPTMGNWIVFILDPADRLNTFSANSLLKILEEAPAHVIFILIAESTGSVIPTILSRCEVVRFQVASHHAAREQLKKHFNLGWEDAARFYGWSEGRFGAAVSLAEDFVDDLPEFYGIRDSHTAYLNELEGFSENLHDRFSATSGLDQALREASRLETGLFLPLQAARKEFCRSLIMSAGLPAAFSLMFTDQLLDRLEKTKKKIRRTFDGLIDEVKAGYSSGMIKEIDGQINSALSAWALNQIEELFHCLLNWYSDALRCSGSKDETLLLNLEQKEDIITIAEADGIDLLRSRISMLEESVYLLRRYVQPSLVIENVLTQIGGPEA